MRKPPVTRPEHEEQVALFSWANIYSARHPCLKKMFAIPNGGKRHIGVAKKLKSEGVKPGVPDLFLPHAANGFNGLFIEMKAVGGALRKSQKEVIAGLIEENYKVSVCYGVESAINEIEKYLKLR